MDSQPNAEPNPQVVAAPARSWFRENRASLILSLIGIALVVRFLHPLDVLLVVIGLGGIVFLHELGHFLAAKACDVHVKTFSVGFGPPLPFCSFQYGETFYKLALVPLGGYVAMVGQSEEGESAEEEQEGKEDPRSYKNKSVLQRMLIISAGVIMNIILGGICFIVAYMNGVEEQPAIVAGIEPGSAAWRAGVRPGERITKIDGMENPWFADLFPVVSGTHAGEQIELVTQKNDQTYTYNMEPVRAEGALFPQIGVAPPSSVTFFSMRRDATPPYDPGSAAALAKSAEGIGFLAGDRIVAMSDPKNPDQITPLDPEKVGLPTPNMEFQQRLIALAGKPVTVEVERKDVGKVQLKVPAVFRKETGMIMQMGPIVALRADSTAEKQGVKVRKQDGEKILEPGDTIIMVQLPEADGKSTIYSSDSKEAPKGPDATVKMLDPFLLPYQLNAWAESWNGKPSPVRTLKLTVSRLVDHTPKPVTLELVWDNSYREQLSYLSNPSTPVPLGGLGLAYQVIAAVQQVLPGSAAEQAGIKVGDKIKQVRVHNLTHTGEEKEGRYADVKEPHYWAYVDYRIQAQAPHTFDVKIDRGGEEVEAKLVATPSTSNPIAVPAEGFIFMKELQRQTASSVGEALQMGARRTMRAIKSTYLGLYSMVFGRTSVMLISGPITLARASYMLAGEDIWKLVLLVALISINLAVVNFLPIPVLDGGHMVFLIYEWIRRKPPPIFLHNALTLLGLGMVLMLMVFAVGLDIWRLIAQKF